MEPQVQADDGEAIQTLPIAQATQPPQATTASPQLMARGRNALNLLEHRAQAAKLAAEVMQLRSALRSAEAGHTQKLELWLEQFDDTPQASNELAAAAENPATKPAPLAHQQTPPQNLTPSWEQYLAAARWRLADIQGDGWPWEQRCAAAQSGQTQPTPAESLALLEESSVTSYAPTTIGAEELTALRGDSCQQDDQLVPAGEDSRTAFQLDDALPEPEFGDSAILLRDGLPSAAKDSRSTRQPKRVWGSLSFSLVGHGLLFLALGTITYRHQDHAVASLGSQVLEAAQASSEEPELGHELELDQPQTAAAAEEMMSVPSAEANLALSDLAAGSSPTWLSNAMPTQSAASSIASAVSSRRANSGTSTSGGGRAGEGGPITSGAFFGVGTGGNYFCYVVDSSGSMRGQAWESAKLELMRSLSSLKPTQQFYIVFFDQEIHAIPEPGQKLPAAHGLFATKDNIDHARRWMETVPLARGGPPTKALAWAIQREPDAIYLLTDGVTKVDVCREVRKVNQIEDWLSGTRVRVPIHPIAYHSLDGQQLMRQLANENNGQFHYVPKPPKP